MQKLMTLTSLFLIAGCSLTQIEATGKPEKQAALFCDVEEKRRFTRKEIAWREANAPWNLKRDFKTNLTFERECEEN